MSENKSLFGIAQIEDALRTQLNQAVDSGYTQCSTALAGGLLYNAIDTSAHAARSGQYLVNANTGSAGGAWTAAQVADNAVFDPNKNEAYAPHLSVLDDLWRARYGYTWVNPNKPKFIEDGPWFVYHQRLRADNRFEKQGDWVRIKERN